MPITDFIAAIQNNNEQAQLMGNLDGGLLFVVAMTTVVVALVVIMFIGSSARGSSKGSGS
jgi:hypothetical protein